ncbi:MMPL family transporter [Streptomyces sp. NPDC006314]|uniref:MMPL family transporter n=1 Tax=Streptomyces sp. NPDC006314 TaxID=3154475 RepID=UPI0033B81ACB
MITAVPVALGRAAVRHRRIVIVLTLLFAAASAVVGHGVAGHLVTGGWAPAGAPSLRADALLTERFHGGAPDLALLARTSSGSVDARAAREDGRRLVARVLADPKVTGAASYWTGPVTGRDASAQVTGPPDAALRSRDGRAALVLVRLVSDTHHTTVNRLVPAVTGGHGTLRVTVSGAALVVRDLQAQSRHDLRRAELIALPATLLLLLWVFGGFGAACLPLAVGLVAVVGTLAVLRVLSGFTEVSLYALNMTTAVGLALAVDYSLFLVARYREERIGGAAHGAAVERTMVTAGRTVLVSASIVALSLTGLLVFPLPFLRSLAYAGIPVVALATAVALVLVPAGLSCFGGRLGTRDRFARWRGTARTGSGSGGRWQRLALAVTRHRVMVAVLAALVLAVCALPFRHVTLALSDERVLPGDAPVVRAMRDVRSAFPEFGSTELDVILPGWTPDRNASRTAALDAYARRLSALPDASSVRTATGVYAHGERLPQPCPAAADCQVLAGRHASPAGTWLAVRGPAEPFGPASVRLARAVRAADAPTGVLVAGPPARLLDVRDAVASRLPTAVTIVVAATLVLLLAFTGGALFLAVKALVMNALSMTATFGAMVWIFQEGHLRWLLGSFTVTGQTDIMSPVTVFCLAFGLSLDYEVLLLARVTEEHRRTGRTTAAVAAGLVSAAPLFTASATVVAAVLLSLAGSGITTIKLIGVTVALSVAVDALIVRPLLVPAVMSLAGEANWWSLRSLVTRTGAGHSPVGDARPS